MSHSRRRVLVTGAQIAAGGAGAALIGGALLSQDGGALAPTADRLPPQDPRRLAGGYDYIVVGSGAGGGPLAVRLAEAGYRTLLLEAGPAEVPEPSYSVPAFHLHASAEPDITWNFFVRHYTDAGRHGRRWQRGFEGMLYPRSSTIGGCTAHHAQLTMAAEDDDWREAARVTGDPRWNPTVMAGFQRTVLSWLPVEFTPPTILLRDRTLARLVAAAAAEAGLPTPRPGHEIDLNSLRLDGLLPDPNDLAHIEPRRAGLFLIPQSTRDGRRWGVREHVLAAATRLGDRLTVQTDALVERVVLEGAGPLRATGVEFRHGRHLYRASPQHRADTPWTRYRVSATREVVLAGGAFNSPQLLMLSGIGPAEQLRRHGLPVHLDLPTVGTSLQDRYEMSVVTRFPRHLDITDGLKFGAAGDPGMAQWTADPLSSVYRSNGILLGVKLAGSDPAEPDVFVFGSPSRFEGYEPGFAERALADPRYFTWAVLKGWSQNRMGTVRLRSADPTEPPDVNFRYFDDGLGGDADLDGVLRGIAFARAVNRRAEDLAWFDQAHAEEVFPGPGLPDGDPRLREFVHREAWGHHASCSNPMGQYGDGRSVVDGRLLVHGTQNLRVVDASVFSRIPGMYPVLAVHMLSEKAARDIVARAEQEAA